MNIDLPASSKRSISTADFSRIEIIFSGDYEDEKVLDRNEDGLMVFGGIPVGSRIKVMALVSTIQNQHLANWDWENECVGASDFFTVADGENYVTIQMVKVSTLYYTITAPSAITRSDTGLTLAATGGIAAQSKIEGTYYWNIGVGYPDPNSAVTGNVNVSLGVYGFSTTSPVLHIPLRAIGSADWEAGQSYFLQIYSNWNRGTLPISSTNSGQYWNDVIVW